MANIFAFANQKGGVGKTTSCVNMAASLAMNGQRVLLLDLDPQGNATMGSGINKGAVKASMNEVLLGEVGAKAAIVYKTPAGYDVIPGNADLTAAEVRLIGAHNPEFRLKDALAPLSSSYDFILMDCPPSLSMLTVNALAAAHAVIIPMQCEYFALEGLSDLLNTVKQLQATINPQLYVAGIIRTMMDARNRLCEEVSSQLIDHFGNKVFQTVVPRNVRLAEAPSHGLPVTLYDRNSRGSAAYMALAAEFLKRFAKEQKRAPLASGAEPVV